MKKAKQLMAKTITTNEKSIILQTILKGFGLEVSVTKSPDNETFSVETGDYLFTLGQPGQADGFLIHAMADASLAVVVMTRIFESVPGLVAYGPFTRETGQFLHGEAAMEIKDRLIINQAIAITNRREFVEPEPQPEPAKSQIILSV